MFYKIQCRIEHNKPVSDFDILSITDKIGSSFSTPLKFNRVDTDFRPSQYGTYGYTVGYFEGDSETDVFFSNSKMDHDGSVVLNMDWTPESSFDDVLWKRINIVLFQRLPEEAFKNDIQPIGTFAGLSTITDIICRPRFQKSLGHITRMFKGSIDKKEVLLYSVEIRNTPEQLKALSKSLTSKTALFLVECDNELYMEKIKNWKPALSILTSQGKDLFQ